MFEALDVVGTLGAGVLALLIAALVAALTFEFVNGFHDTANAVATVIYTKTLKPTPAVALSGLCNFLGVMTAGVAVAMEITRLLPLELLVSGGIGRSLATVLSLLFAAVVWNLGTWYFGIPASSSHTLIGSILGVGLASSAMAGHFGQGVNWSKATGIGLSLLVSPLVGVLAAGGLLLLMKALIKDKRIFEEPKGDAAPPGWIRSLLVLTCCGVSYAHGSNDGQKGIGLIMLILIGVVPAGYSLDLGASSKAVEDARRGSAAIAAMLEDVADECPASVDASDPLDPACELLRDSTLVSVALAGKHRIAELRDDDRWQVRAALLRMQDALKHYDATTLAPSAADSEIKAALEQMTPLTNYAPLWVIVAVALALGIGTTVGWKRIVVTVGEKIGKSHLTYAQGAAAELVAAATIAAASKFGLPVSTTHVLSSGIAGTMLVNKSGLQGDTVRNIALAWVLTLPCSMLLAGVFFWILTLLIG